MFISAINQKLKIKRVVSVILIGIIALGGMLNILNVSAMSEDEIYAPSAVLMEPLSCKVLFEKNPHEVRACASITKVMTLILVFEAIEDGKFGYDDTVTASAHAASMGGSDIWLEEGETMTVHEMIKAVVVASANDAAVALAELVSGTEDEFVARMNDKAKLLGMNNTVFKNCNGLDEEGHLTTAYDVALMSCELIKHKKIFEYSSIWIDYLRGGETQIVNTNKLLKTYKGITGLKTGTTSQAGSCISATAQRDNLSLVAVALGSDSGTHRFADAAKLLDYGFANYKTEKLTIPKDALCPLSVKGGMMPFVNVECKVKESVLLPKSNSSELEANISLKEDLQAPIESGEVVGKITYSFAGSTVDEYDIVTSSSVEPVSFGKILKLLFQNLISL